jgi:hypothetical protein
MEILAACPFKKSPKNRVAEEFLIGGWPTPLKNMSSSVGIIIPNIWIAIGKP